MTPNAPKISSIQRLMRRYIEWYFPTLTIAENIRPSQRAIDDRGKGREEYRLYGLELEGLEIDLYLPQIRVAVEVNGSQHYRPVDYFHADRIKPSWWQKLLGKKPTIDRSKVQQRFTGQLRRDARKAELLAQQDVKLITLDHSDRLYFRLANKMRLAADWGLTHTSSPHIQTRIQQTDWTRRPPDSWMGEWDRLARAGVRGEIKRKGKSR